MSLSYLEKWLPEINETSTFHKKYSECYKILNKHFDFARWDFSQSYILAQDFPTIIYDSDLCRVKLVFNTSGNMYDYTPYLQVFYGRMHAPNNDEFMTLKEEKFWCWHDVFTALNFLDGLSPEDAFSNKNHPDILRQFESTNLAKHLKTVSPAEFNAGLQSEIWNHYGLRLFGLFDLNHPELWEEYKNFLKEYYKIEMLNDKYYLLRSDKNPSRSKVC